jgi:dethiobiotin synthetase
MSGALFVTGTGTDVGKTYVTALLVKKLVQLGKNPAYYKAAMSGNSRGSDGSLIPGDAKFVRKTAGLSQPLGEMCPYVYEHAWSPHLAARTEGNPVELSVVKQGFDAVAAAHDYVTVEGSGGILCPIRYDETEKLFLEDIVQALNLPSILVADAGLGTINSVVLTASYMKAKGLPVRGVIFNRFHPNDRMEQDNVLMCEAMTGLPTLALVRDGDTELDIDPNVLISLYERK